MGKRIEVFFSSAISPRCYVFRKLAESFLSGQLQREGFDAIESVGRIAETFRREMRFQLPQQVLTLRFAGDFDGYAAFVIRRSCGRSAKIATGQSTQAR